MPITRYSQNNRISNIAIILKNQSCIKGEFPWKKSLLIIGITSLAFWACNASALDLTQTDGAGAEAKFTETATAIPGAADLVFKPSTQVVFAGESNKTSFAIDAYHAAVLNKTSGQAYGMAGDSKKVFFCDISTTAAYSTVQPDGTNAGDAFLAASGWTSM